MFQSYFASGDLGFLWKEQIDAFSWLPTIWHPDLGFGFHSLITLWLDYPFRLVVKLLSTIGLSWFVIEKLLWGAVFLLCGQTAFALSSYVFGKKYLGFFSSVIYTANTYILLLFAGGQLGVALAYAFAPYVLLSFIRRSEDAFLIRSIKNGMALGLLIAFDLRLAYIVTAAGLLYVFWEKSVWKMCMWVFSLVITSMIHAYWIFPLVFGGKIPSLGEQFTHPAMVNFLSFADFSHALSLLHPHWPENLFGKTYFLQPEFLIVPILAFSSLLFLSTTKALSANSRRALLFFAFLSLLGVFLAKGMREPYGGIYEWLFLHVPGFVMFRDPTKFYLYIALGYSILIPFAVEKVSSHMQKRLLFRSALFVLFIIFWMYTLRGVFAGEVKGNFRPVRLTDEHVRLKDMLVKDSTPSRVLWLPQKDVFAVSLSNHPLLSASQLLKDASMSAMIKLVNTAEFEKTLTESGVGYVIVPQDVDNRIFLDDYKINRSERNRLIEALDKTSLVRDQRFLQVGVYTHNNFLFHSAKPAYVARQEYLALLGATMTVITLLCSTIFLRLKR